MRKIIFGPFQKWRVFAGEVGVIVLGVLIALGAQELVTSWNDRQRSDDAMSAIRNEIALHDFNTAEIEITFARQAARARSGFGRLLIPLRAA